MRTKLLMLPALSLDTAPPPPPINRSTTVCISQPPLPQMRLRAAAPWNIPLGVGRRRFYGGWGGQRRVGEALDGPRSTR